MGAASSDAIPQNYHHLAMSLCVYPPARTTKNNSRSQRKKKKKKKWKRRLKEQHRETFPSLGPEQQQMTDDVFLSLL